MRLLLIVVLMVAGCAPPPSSRPEDTKLRVDNVLIRDVGGACVLLDGRGKINDIHIVHDSLCKRLEDHAANIEELKSRP